MLQQVTRYTHGAANAEADGIQRLPHRWKRVIQQYSVVEANEWKLLVQARSKHAQTDLSLGILLVIPCTLYYCFQNIPPLVGNCEPVSPWKKRMYVHGKLEELYVQQTVRLPTPNHHPCNIDLTLRCYESVMYPMLFPSNAATGISVS
ncbi:hypothetical protein TNCV_1404431 [Trichonephila clavipes]|nr:hypothetical protein TNCV_1404431 [Trichonephila clavipes]